MMLPIDNILSLVTGADPFQVVFTFQQLNKNSGSVNDVPTLKGNLHSAIRDSKIIALERIRLKNNLYVLLLKTVVMT